MSIHDNFDLHEQELLAIQQQGPTAIGFFGTRNMGFTHQQLIEVLSYAMVITVCINIRIWLDPEKCLIAVGFQFYCDTDVCFSAL